MRLTSKINILDRMLFVLLVHSLYQQVKMLALGLEVKLVGADEGG